MPVCLDSLVLMENVVSLVSEARREKVDSLAPQVYLDKMDFLGWTALLDSRATVGCQAFLVHLGPRAMTDTRAPPVFKDLLVSQEAREIVDSPAFPEPKVRPGLLLLTAFPVKRVCRDFRVFADPRDHLASTAYPASRATKDPQATDNLVFPE